MKSFYPSTLLLSESNFYSSSFFDHICKGIGGTATLDEDKNTIAYYYDQEIAGSKQKLSRNFFNLMKCEQMNPTEQRNPNSTSCAQRHQDKKKHGKRSRTGSSNPDSLTTTFETISTRVSEHSSKLPSTRMSTWSSDSPNASLSNTDTCETASTDSGSTSFSACPRYSLKYATPLHGILKPTKSNKNSRYDDHCGTSPDHHHSDHPPPHQDFYTNKLSSMMFPRSDDIFTSLSFQNKNSSNRKHVRFTKDTKPAAPMVTYSKQISESSKLAQQRRRRQRRRRRQQEQEQQQRTGNQGSLNVSTNKKHLLLRNHDAIVYSTRALLRDVIAVPSLYYVTAESLPTLGRMVIAV